jgi:hypothetical protein
MVKILRTTAVFALLISAAACAARTPTVSVMVPPQIDLKAREVIGVIGFSAPSRGDLGPLVTRRFVDSARRDQGLVRIVDLGSQEQALRTVGKSVLDADAFAAIGRQARVKTILVGALTVSKVKPDLRLAADLRSGSVTAQVDATLAVQMIEASSGASLWSRSAGATSSVGHVTLLGGGHFYLDADDPARAYGGLVDSLVERVARPFHVSWERREVVPAG